MICNTLTPAEPQDTTVDTSNIHTNSTNSTAPSPRSDIIHSHSNNSLLQHKSPSLQQNNRQKKRVARLLNTIRTSHDSSTTAQQSDNSTVSESDTDETESEEYDINELTPLPRSLCCTVCQLFLYKPVTLQCGHSICCTCIKAFIPDEHGTIAKPAVCPILSCRKPILNAAYLQTCIALSAVLENGFTTEYNYSRQYHQAVTYYENGKYSSAVRTLNQLIQSMPYTVQNYCLRILCYLQLQQFSDAIHDTHTAIHVYNYTIHNSKSASVRFPNGTVYTTIDISTATNVAPPLNQPITYNNQLDELNNTVPQNVTTAQIMSPDSAAYNSEQAEKLIGVYSTPAIEFQFPHLSVYLCDYIDSLSAFAEMALSTNLYTHAIHAYAIAIRFAAVVQPDSKQVLATQMSDAIIASNNNKTSTESITQQQLTELLNNLSPNKAQTLPSVAELCDKFQRYLIELPPKKRVLPEMQCMLCMSLLYEPVTTQCGHTMCKTCLQRSIDHHPNCPTCRAPITTQIMPTQQYVNISLLTVQRNWLPYKLIQRIESVQTDIKLQNEWLPIFVVTLLYPGVLCPLHVFEPRYRLMIRNVIQAGGNKIGMCLHQPSAQGGFSDVGTIAQIRSVSLLQDGRAIVEVYGERRFVVRDRSMKNGYSVAKVEYFDDVSDDIERTLTENKTPALHELIQHCRRYTAAALTRVARLNRANAPTNIVMPDDPTHFAYWLMSSLPVSLPTSYHFLQLRTSYERYTLLATLLDRVLQTHRELQPSASPEPVPQNNTRTDENDTNTDTHEPTTAQETEGTITQPASVVRRSSAEVARTVRTNERRTRSVSLNTNTPTENQFNTDAARAVAHRNAENCSIM